MQSTEKHLQCNLFNKITQVFGTLLELKHFFIITINQLYINFTEINGSPEVLAKQSRWPGLNKHSSLLLFKLGVKMKTCAIPV